MIEYVKGTGDLYIIEFLNDEEEPTGLFFAEEDVIWTINKKKAKHFDTFSKAWIRGMELIDSSKCPFKFFDVYRHGTKKRYK